MAKSAVLAIKILADSAPAKKGFKEADDAGANAASKIKSSFKNVGKVVAGAFALDKGISFITDSVKGYQEHLAILKQTSQVIATTGGAAKVTVGHINSLASSLENYTGIDGDVINQGANMLLTFTNIRNEVGKGNDVFDQATSIVTDMSAALGTDLKGQAIQVGKALNDPVKGIAALSKVGVSFSSQQKAVIDKMVKTGDTLGAQKVILKELNKEFGGTAHAIETPAQKMAVQFRNVQDAVGQALLPVMNAFLGILTKYILPAIVSTVGWIQKNAKVIKTVAIVLSPLVAAWALYATITKTVAIAQGILNAVMAANPVVLVVAAIAALVAGLIIAYNKCTVFREIVQAAFNVVLVIVKGVANFFTVDLPNAFLAVGRGLKTAWDIAFAFLKTWGPVALAVLVPFIGIPLLIFQHFHAIIGWLSGIWSTVFGGVKNFVSNIVGAIGSIPGKILGFVSAVKNAGLKFLGGFWDGVKAAFSGLGGAVEDGAKAVVNAVVTALNKVLSLPWVIKVHIPIPFAPDINIGPYTIMPSIPLWSSAKKAVPATPDIDSLAPGFTLFAASGMSTWTADVAPSARELAAAGSTTIVKVEFKGIVTDPEGTAREIKKLLDDSDSRNGRK